MTETPQGQPLAPGHNRSKLTTTAKGGQRLNRMQLPWFTAVPPRGFGVLTTRGRKTGRPRETCVRAVRDGSTVYVVAIMGERTGWMSNLRAHPNDVQLRIRGGTYKGRAREIAADESARARAAYAQFSGLFEFLESFVHLSGRPNRDKLRRMHEHWFDTGTAMAIDINP
jgi:deazaflavin-dependent oxidoreductase (nitroreductase family)